MFRGSCDADPERIRALVTQVGLCKLAGHHCHINVCTF